MTLGSGLLEAGAAETAGTMFSMAASSTMAALPSIGSMLAIGGTAASMFGSISAGQQKSDILNLQARQSELDARYETLKGKEQSRIIQKNLERDLASQNAYFATRGLLEGEGSAETAMITSKESATKDINAAMFGSEYASNVSNLQATQYRMSGRSAETSGYTNALGTLVSSRAANNMFKRIGL